VAVVLEVGRDRGSVTTRDGAATLPCFIESTTSLSSAWLKPSMSTGVGGQARAADAEPAAPGHVLDRVGDVVVALGLRDRPT
jgi:hypothetical protein